MSNVLKISEACSLAIHSVVYLAAWPGKCFSTREIAADMAVSENHLAKVLQRLAKDGIVTAVRGPKGGFKLGNDAEQMKLLDLYEIFDGTILDPKCLLGKQLCQGDNCVLGGLLSKVTEQVFTYLNETTVSQLTTIFTDKPCKH